MPSSPTGPLSMKNPPSLMVSPVTPTSVAPPLPPAGAADGFPAAGPGAGPPAAQNTVAARSETARARGRRGVRTFAAPQGWTWTVAPSVPGPGAIEARPQVTFNRTSLESTPEGGPGGPSRV